MNPSIKEFLKSGSVLEKPGESVHTAKWDRCVADVKAKGNANAYAVCTAMLGDESFKSATTEEEEKAQIDLYMRKLGIGGAGPVPNSLLARQDLETTQKSMKNLEVTIHKGEDVSTKAVFEGTELYDLVMLEMVDGHEIYAGPDMADSNGHMVGCYVVAAHDGSWQAFFTIEATREFIASVFKTTHENGFVPHEDVITEEEEVRIFDEMARKGAVEQTGKQLDRAARMAKTPDVATDSIVENIKNIQLRRQRATIKERESEEGATTKSFKDTWSGITKDAVEMSMPTTYSVHAYGANGMCAFMRDFMNKDMFDEVLANVKRDYKGHTIEVSNDRGMREVIAP